MTALRTLGGLSTLLTQGAEGSLWMPPGVSTVARHVDWLFHFILAISVFFFVLIVVVMTLFVIRYRRRAAAGAEASAKHNTALELAWTIIPVILVAVIFFFGFRGYLDMTTPPANAYEILVDAQKWNWSFTYPNGYVDSSLHVPVNRPVRLVMTSADVIHSLYIPAFRIKQDVVPGRYSKVWFEATVPGEYQLFCAEYCGAGHSGMLATVVVHPPGEFEAWLEKASNVLATMTPVDAGRNLFQVRGCMQCHSVDGTAKVGPSLLGIYGHSQPLADGSKVTVDENYVRESILEPMAKVAAGYEPVMPTYQGRLTDAEIMAIIEYLKSLSRKE